MEPWSQWGTWGNLMGFKRIFQGEKNTTVELESEVIFWYFLNILTYPNYPIQNGVMSGVETLVGSVCFLI